MMKNPKNLAIFAGLGGAAGFILGRLVFGLNFHNDKRAEPEILAVLDGQVDAWNTGDIEAYMQDYLKGDDLRFASGGNIESGWQPTLDRYLRRYPDRSAMGRLETVNLDVQVIDKDDALVFGTWALIRDKDRPSGLYTLHMKKIDGNWVVASDHTSSAE